MDGASHTTWTTESGFSPAMATPGSALYPAVFEFLSSQGLTKTAKALLAEAAMAAPPPPADPEIMGIFRGLSGLVAGKRKRDDNGAAPPASKKPAPAPKAASSDDDSDDSDSDSDSDDDKKPAAAPAAKKDDSDDSDDDDDDDDDGAPRARLHPM